MDDDSTPMSRTELAMLWDLCGRWLASHPENGEGLASLGALTLRLDIDAELAERFGG